MNNASRRIISIALGLAFIIGGFLIARHFMTNKPEASRRRAMSSMVPVVETETFSAATQPLFIDCLGTVTADKNVSLQPQVSGRIVAVNPGLVEGGLVQKDEVLVEIEAADYELAVAQAEANLLTAQSNLRIEEGQQDVVRHELALMGNDEDDAYRDLMLREPQLKSAEAAVKSAELALESARLDLDRTKIRAPFDAVVVMESADVGDYAQSSAVLVQLAATDRYFIRASIPLSSLQSMPGIGQQVYPATLTMTDGTTRTAETHQLLPGLTETGRMARILLKTDNPYKGTGRPLLLNEVIRVKIQGREANDALLLPRKLLRDGNVLWTIDADNKLRILRAEILQGYADSVLVNLEDRTDVEIVMTDLSAAVEGMQLRRAGEKSPPPEDGMKPDAAKGEQAEKEA